MSRNPEADAITFAALTHGLDSKVSVERMLPRNLPFLPMDGQRVFVDGDLGESFRLGLFKVFAAGMLEAGVSAADPSMIAQDVVDEICPKVANSIGEDDSPIQTNELVAVNGLGLFLGIKKSAQEGVLPQCLDPSSNLFGMLYGVSPYSPNLRKALDAADGKTQVDIYNRRGLAMMLQDVVICEATSYGPKERSYAKVLIPLPEADLKIYKTYPQE